MENKIKYTKVSDIDYVIFSLGYTAGTICHYLNLGVSFNANGKIIKNGLNDEPYRDYYNEGDGSEPAPTLISDEKRGEGLYIRENLNKNEKHDLEILKQVLTDQKCGPSIVFECENFKQSTNLFDHVAGIQCWTTYDHLKFEEMLDFEMIEVEFGKRKMRILIMAF